MSAERFVVAGLAKVRAPWFADVAKWSNTSRLPLEFLKCVSATEAHARIASGRAISALLVDAGVPGLDRDLIDKAREAQIAVVVVTDGRADRDWVQLGAAAVLPGTFDASTLLACLVAHAPPIRTITDRAAAAEPTDRGDAGRWRGRLVAVTGGPGAGVSTISMALAQGVAGLAGNEGSVLLADLAGCGDQAMYHDIGDVVPGLQELVEAHRTGTPSGAAIRRLVYDIEERAYSVLLGLRRTRDWTALRPKALEAAVESLRTSFRFVVADVRGEFDGERETGSIDIEERNGPARLAVSSADAVVVCGDAGLKGIHALVRAERDLVAAGVDASRCVRVVNRAPRSPRQRSEITSALAELSTVSHRFAPVFVPERRHLDVVHGVVDRLPGPMVDPVARAVTAVLGGADLSTSHSRQRNGDSTR